MPPQRHDLRAVSAVEDDGERSGPCVERPPLLGFPVVHVIMLAADIGGFVDTKKPATVARGGFLAPGWRFRPQASGRRQRARTSVSRWREIQIELLARLDLTQQHRVGNRQAQLTLRTEIRIGVIFVDPSAG
jgi:hypothetical protein